MSVCSLYNSVNVEEKITFTVQSSYILNVPKQLIIHSANLELLNAIGQGEDIIVIYTIPGKNII